MELLIPGLILVGFMVWASTRIKRNAAKAFEREEIDTNEFSITKPEGFLAPVDPGNGLLFSAYSKEFGSGEAGRTRRATAEIRRFSNVRFDEIRKLAKKGVVKVVSEQNGVLDERKCANIVVERSEKDVAVETSFKIVAGQQAIFQLAINVLPEDREEFSQRLQVFLNSFALK